MRLRRFGRFGLAAALAVTAAATVLAGPAFAQPPDDDGDVSTQIINGRQATEVYSFFTSLQNSSGSHFCGGSLIHKDWVVTAAHCVNSTPYQVRIGSTNYTTGGQVVRVASKVVHPGGMQGHDIALLKLSTPATKTPIAISANTGTADDPVRLIGHGQTCPNQGGCGQSQPLMEVDTTVAPDSSCSGMNASSELCLGEVNEGACYGDSGGPSVHQVNGKWELTGATSRSGTSSTTCARAPAIYGDVLAHKSWIEQSTGPLTPPDDPPPGEGSFRNDTDVPIADLATVESPIEVTGRTGNAPSALKVSVAIKHTYRGDLRIDLVAPDGSVYRVKNSSTSDSADDVNATYTVDASSEPANGTWKLRVADVARYDTGHIDSWALQF